RASNIRQYASRSMRGRSTKRRLALRSLLNISNRAFYIVAVRFDRGAPAQQPARTGVRSVATQDRIVRLDPCARTRAVAGWNRPLDHRLADRGLRSSHPRAWAAPGHGHELLAAQRVFHV